MQVRFAPYSSQWLLVSSWDSTVRFYDLESNSQRGRFNRQLAVLDATFESDKSKIYSGGIDNLLTLSDVSTGIDTVVGNHEKPISCVEYCPEMNLILTGSWDWSLKMWDPRSNNALKGTFSQPDKVYCMSLAGEKLVVATANRKVSLIFFMGVLHRW